ncbi:MAG: hypothetical protein M1484_01680 [Patescibacteria group bacterium]|nr:hypothetical protein [Patescibacteria group bacterium]MCL5431790.1 hypothetical protein [Patescibacteria group bacterium]
MFPVDADTQPLEPEDLLAIPDWMQKKEIVHVDVGVKPADLKASAVHCLADPNHAAMEIALMRYLAGDEVIVETTAPGYRCAIDGLGFLSNRVMAEFLPKAAEVLRLRGQDSDARSLQQRIDVIQAQFKEQGRYLN